MTSWPWCSDSIIETLTLPRSVCTNRAEAILSARLEEAVVQDVAVKQPADELLPDSKALCGLLTLETHHLYKDECLRVVVEGFLLIMEGDFPKRGAQLGSGMTNSRCEDEVGEERERQMLRKPLREK